MTAHDDTASGARTGDGRGTVNRRSFLAAAGAAATTTALAGCIGVGLDTPTLNVIATLVLLVLAVVLAVAMNVGDVVGAVTAGE